MWSKISSALKQRDGNDADTDNHSNVPPPDPFCANATTYYTHQMPPTPPPSGHSRTASREEDLILSLRTQLALQQEMCSQFEIDLRARDELVETLMARLAGSEQENDKRKNVLRSWKKKAANLEKMCRHLEEEVDHSRRESMERSIMDEASGEALRQLHRQISQLEREKNDVEAERNALAKTVKNLEAETRLQEQLGMTEEAGDEEVHELHHRILQVEQEKNSVEVERNTLVQEVRKAEVEIAKLREELCITDEAGADAMRQLHSQIAELVQEKNDLLVERDTVAQAREEADAETLRLQEELASAEETNREALRRLHDQISQLEREKNEVDTALSEARKKTDFQIAKLKEELVATSNARKEAEDELCDQVLQLQREKTDIESERNKLSSEIPHLRAHVQQLRKDSAVMEVTIVQLNKQLDQNKEDINGLNIALESKQQELELVKRKHGRSALAPVPTRPSTNSSTTGKSAGHTGPPVKASRNSIAGMPTSPTVVPKNLARTVSTRPPVTSALRRTSISMESKTRLPNRRVSITSIPSESEKENSSAPVPMSNPRRSMIPA